MRTFVITAAALLAGTATAMAQTSSEQDDNGNNGHLLNAGTQNPKGNSNSDSTTDRAQGQLQDSAGRAQAQESETGHNEAVESGRVKIPKDGNRE